MTGIEKNKDSNQGYYLVQLDSLLENKDLQQARLLKAVREAEAEAQQLNIPAKSIAAKKFIEKRLNEKMAEWSRICNPRKFYSYADAPPEGEIRLITYQGGEFKEQRDVSMNEFLQDPKNQYSEYGDRAARALLVKGAVEAGDRTIRTAKPEAEDVIELTGDLPTEKDLAIITSGIRYGLETAESWLKDKVAVGAVAIGLTYHGDCKPIEQVERNLQVLKLGLWFLEKSRSHHADQEEVELYRRLLIGGMVRGGHLKACTNK